MRWSFFILLLVVVSINAQQKPQNKKYAEQNFGKMMTLQAAHDNFIPMDSEKFKNLVKTKNKDYSVVAMFTALKPSFKCGICPQAKKEYDILTYSHEAMFPASKNLFFVLVDIHNSQEAFQTMNLKHVPAVYYFPANRKRKKSDTYDARKMGYKANGMSAWLSEAADIKIKIITPFDFTKLIVAIAVLFPIFLLTLWKPDVMTRLMSNRIIWTLIIMTVVLIMTSGQMWNHIRKPPDASRNSKGGVEYIHGSRSGQFVFESYMVMGINGAISLGFILLNEVQAFKGRNMRRVFGFVGLGMVVIFFGLLIFIFRMKNRSYPYSFLFL